jgi:hypothetical protein
MKIQLSLLLWLISFALLAQVETSNFTLTDKGTRKNGAFTNNTHFLFLDKPQGTIIIKYKNSASDSIKNLELINTINYDLSNNFKIKNDYWEAEIKYDIINQIDELDIRTIYGNSLDTVNKTINIRLYLKAVSINNIALFAVPYNQTSETQVITGEYLEYLHIIDQRRWLKTNHPKLEYKYSKDDDNRISLQIRNSHQIDTSYENVIIKLYTSDEYYDKNGIMDYKEFQIGKVNITIPVKKNINFVELTDVFLDSNNDALHTISIEDQNNLSEHYKFPINDIISGKIIANITLYKDNGLPDGQYKCRIEPLLSTENSVPRNLSAEIENVDYQISNLDIYALPTVKLENKKDGKILNTKALYFEKQHTVCFYGINLHKLKFDIPFGHKLVESSKTQMLYSVKLPYDNTEDKEEIIKVIYPKQINRVDTFKLVKKILYTKNPPQPDKNEFVTIKFTDKKDNDVKWGANKKYLYQKRTKQISITFKNEMLGNMKSSIYYGEPDFNITITHGNRDKYVGRIDLSDTNNFEYIESANKTLELDKISHAWDTIKIDISNDKMSYTFDNIYKASTVSYHIRSVGITSNPLTYDIKNGIWINTTFIKLLNFGANFYKEDVIKIRQPRFLSSINLGFTGAYNTVASTKTNTITPWDYGIALEMNFNIIDLNIFNNESGYGYEAFNISLGFAYLFQNQAPLITIGLGFAFRDMKAVFKNK